MELLGILIIIIGFGLKFNAIAIIFLAALVTAMVNGIELVTFLEILGTSFTSNRSMTIFILIMFVAGTLERNGLKENILKLISKTEGASPGKIIGVYGFIRSIFSVFNVSFGGIAGFVRPIIVPLAVGTLESKEGEVKEEYIEEIKAMSTAMENIAWFFCQILCIGGSGSLLVQSTLMILGYDIELVELVIKAIPVAVFSTLISVSYFYIRDEKLMKKYYGKENNDEYDDE